MTNTIIIGGGLSGLFLAHRLHQAGQKVTLLEARESLGGRYRRPSPTEPYASPSLDLIAASPEHLALLDWFKSLSPIPFNFTVREHRPQIFNEGRWMPFAGFGDVSFQSVGELSALFGHTHYAEISPGLDQVTRALVEQLPFSALTMARVTDLKLTDGRVTELIYNGDKSLRADQFIFTPHPAQLNDLIKGEDLPVKYRTRLAKMQSWTAVTLELTHTPPLVDDSSIRFFSHNAKDFEPVVGRVVGALSKWITMVPGDRDTDHEYIGQCLRHIKRQLKRAWPLALEAHGQPDRERIYVQANAFGQHPLKTKEAYRFPEIPNLYLANDTLATLPGEAAALEPARTLETELCGPLARLPEQGASC